MGRVVARQCSNITWRQDTAPKPNDTTCDSKGSMTTLTFLPPSMQMSHWRATPQMSMKKGLKVFGKDGIKAVKKEMLQLHDRKVMEPKHAAELTHDQKQEALAYLMFLKRKRCGQVKGRGCTDSQKQRAYTAHEDAASPTVATESVFLTAVIDALEG